LQRKTPADAKLGKCCATGDYVDLSVNTGPPGRGANGVLPTLIQIDLIDRSGGAVRTVVKPSEDDYGTGGPTIDSVSGIGREETKTWTTVVDTRSGAVVNLGPWAVGADGGTIALSAPYGPGGKAAPTSCRRLPAVEKPPQTHVSEAKLDSRWAFRWGNQMSKPTALPVSDSKALTPDDIMQLGFGFWGSRALLSAVELKLFGVLSQAGPLDAEQLRERLGLHPRSARDFFDALVALGMLDRTDGRYENTPQTDLFLDPAKPTYVGGVLEMSSVRLYNFWGSLTEGLQTGQPQSEVKTGGEFFETLYADPEKLAGFTAAMTGLSRAAGEAIAEKFAWRDYGSVIDIGCAQGAVPVAIATAHDHLTGGGYDLPPVEPIFNSYVAQHDLAGRLQFTPGDFFADPLPSADVLVMGHILHDWDMGEKRLLLQKAYDALPNGGALIVYEALIDDDRRHNAFGLLMSLNMLIEGLGGFDYTGADCRGWMADVGFSKSYVEHLVGPDSMVVGIK
jgi:hypothetical protein